MQALRVTDLKIQLYNTEDGFYQEVVHGISFAIKEGETVGIIGESGAGKSISMKAMKGILPEGSKVTGSIEVIREDIAMIFQDTSGCLNPTMKIAAQLVETIRAHDKFTKKEALKQAEYLLQAVGITNPAECMQQYPFMCSGGMRQRIVIAIALACHAKILIADEPTSALDATVQLQMIRILQKVVREQKLTLLFVSHDMGAVTQLCDRVLVMKEGSIIEQGTLDELYNNPKEAYTKSLFQQIPYPKRRKQQNIEMPLVCMERVTKAFEQNSPAVNEVSFTINKGEIYGLVGESGSGKTTLARMLLGMVKPDSGHIFYREDKIDSLNKKQMRTLWNHMQMIFQDAYSSLNPDLTIEQTLRETIHLDNLSLINCIRGSKGRADKKKTGDRINDILQGVGLESSLKNRYPRELSGGQCQRVGIARALLKKPDFLVCDEPTAALDVNVRKQIIELLCELKEEQRLTYLFIAHDLSLIQQISDRIGVMYGGMLVEEADSERMMQERWHPYTRELWTASRKANTKVEKDTGAETGIKDSKNDGCPYVGNCSCAMGKCRIEKPEMYQYENHRVACFLYE